LLSELLFEPKARSLRQCELASTRVGEERRGSLPVLERWVLRVTVPLNQYHI
jgi:hypothetical protein